ncbi:MAG: hypothetical protein KDN20_12390 [Verrucomicrobiae bacterium]|nr:hypothetical protein [Verrucomicrobiae bacterium]
MPPPFNPYDAGGPEPFDSLEPFEPVAWRARTPESDFSAQGYDRALIDSVWENGDRIAGNDPALWRKDQFGAWMHRLDYGKRHSEFGWEICDLSAGRGNGGLAALRPMQWQNYVDQVAALTRSRMTADGSRNVRKLV